MGNLIEVILYKYIPPARMDVLVNRQIRYTQPALFTDPFEFRPYLSALASDKEATLQFREQMRPALDQVRSELPPELRNAVATDDLVSILQPLQGKLEHQFLSILGGITPAIRRLMDRALTLRIGVLSLTEKCDNLLMWAHYAQNHEGIVIGFDSTNPHFDQRRSDKDELRHLRKVEYRRNRPRYIMSDANGVDILLVKSTHWKYEQEWRILRAIDDADKVIENNSACPISLFAYPPAAVTDVIMGCRMEPEIGEELLAALAAPEYAHVVLHQAEPDEREFRLNITVREQKRTPRRAS